MDFFEAIAVAGFLMAVVFAVLFFLFCVIKLFSAILQKIDLQMKADEKEK